MSHIHCQDTYAFHWLSAFRVLVFDQWLTRYVTRHVIAHTLSRHTRISLAVSMVMEWRRRWHHCFVTWPKDLVIVCYTIGGSFNCHCVSSPYIRNERVSSVSLSPCGTQVSPSSSADRSVFRVWFPVIISLYIFGEKSISRKRLKNGHHDTSLC